MQIELVERLREIADNTRVSESCTPENLDAAVIDEAADRITALEAENARLRKELTPYLKEHEAREAAKMQMRTELAEERAAQTPEPKSGEQ